MVADHILYLSHVNISERNMVKDESHDLASYPLYTESCLTTRTLDGPVSSVSSVSSHRFESKS
jgi:hypothetical protein